MKYQMILAMAGVATLAACANAGQQMAEKGIKPMTATQVQETFVGKTTCGKSARGNENCTYFGANGQVSAKDYTYGGSNAGTYTVDGQGQLCLTWTQDKRWPSSCVRAYPVASGAYAMITKEGMEVFSISEVLQGNPKGL